MSENGKRGTCQRTGESAVATGADGADGVWVLIMYCSGAAYLNKIYQKFCKSILWKMHDVTEV